MEHVNGEIPFKETDDEGYSHTYQTASYADYMAKMKKDNWGYKSRKEALDDFYHDVDNINDLNRIRGWGFTTTPINDNSEVRATIWDNEGHSLVIIIDNKYTPEINELFFTLTLIKSVFASRYDEYGSKLEKAFARVLRTQSVRDDVVSSDITDYWNENMKMPTSKETLERVSNALSTDAIVVQYVPLPNDESNYTEIVDSINDIAANIGVYVTKLLMARYGGVCQDETLADLANLTATRVVDLALGGAIFTENPFGRSVIERSYESIAENMRNPVNKNNDILKYMKLKGGNNGSGIETQ